MALLKRVSLKGVVVSRDNNNNNIRRAVVDIIVRAIVRPILEEGDDIFATSAIFFLYFKTLNIRRRANPKQDKSEKKRTKFSRRGAASQSISALHKGRTPGDRFLVPEEEKL